MTFRRIPLFGKKLFSRRRIVVVLLSFPLIAYVLFFLTPERQKLITLEHTQSIITAPECPCNYIDKQVRMIAASTERIIPSAGKVANGSSLSPRRLNVHVWSDICGTRVDNLRNSPHFPYFSYKSYSISDFYTFKPFDIRNSGERIFGFVHPHLSGGYKFAIVSDDTSELWLSPDEDPASSQMIARVFSPHRASAWIEERDYKKYPYQISKEIFLYAGSKYYIETLSKPVSRITHLAIYWSHGSSSSSFEIISSQYVSSFSEDNNNEVIPPHAGKLPKRSLQSRSKLYDFYRLPFVKRQEYIGVIPACQYNPSFLVRRKLRQYEGVWLPKQSLVFPDDDTDMFKSTSNPSWSKPNTHIDRNTVEYVVSELMLSLRSR